MLVNIKNKENEQVIISFGKEKLRVNIGKDAQELNPEWNTKKINEFLINLAATTPLNEKLELSFDKVENTIYNYIVTLFKGFIDEYNK